MRRYHLKWVDSRVGMPGWIPIESFKDAELAHCEAEGFLVYEDEEMVVMALLLSDDTVNGWALIPKNSIKERKIVDI